jgi:16S rRNA (uracil1498-N3)-methyltransferase
MKNRFLLQAESLTSPGEITLSPEESHHLARVLRMQTGEEIEVVDGQGSVGVATIIDVNPKAAKAQVQNVRKEAQACHIVLAFGIPKANACDFILHRCTEIGIKAFQPLITAHSLHPKEWNQGRWEKVVLETCKQCQESWFPIIRKPQTLDDWLATQSGSPLFYCDEEERKAQPSVPVGKDVFLLIGPEGGWSREEIASFRKNGGVSLGLGKNRLRTETAALVATTLLKQMRKEL